MSAPTSQAHARHVILEHRTLIDAPSELVWDVVSDIEHWSEFIGHFRRVERAEQGPFAVGTSARIRQICMPATTWTVTELVEGESFTWSSHTGGLTWVGTHQVRPRSTGIAEPALRLELDGKRARPAGALLGPAPWAALGREKRAVRRGCSRQPSDS